MLAERLKIKPVPVSPIREDLVVEDHTSSQLAALNETLRGVDNGSPRFDIALIKVWDLSSNVERGSLVYIFLSLDDPPINSSP